MPAFFVKKSFNWVASYRPHQDRILLDFGMSLNLIHALKDRLPHLSPGVIRIISR